VRLGALALAAALFQPAAAAGPWDGLSDEELSLHHAAVAHWGRGMHETAAKEFESLLPMSTANLGTMRLSQRKYEAALPHLERAARLEPDSPRLRYLLGKCLLGLERADDAIAELSAAARLDPKEPAIPLRLSEAYLLAGRGGPARAELRRVLSLRPDHGAALNRLGRLLEADGEKKEAAALLERFARLGKRKARLSERCAYEDPLEPAPTAAPPSGGRWLDVKTVGLDKGGGAVVTVQAGRLILRARAGTQPVRFLLGDRAKVDVIRVDWPDGTQTHRVGAAAGEAVVVEEVSAHVW